MVMFVNREVQKKNLTNIRNLFIAKETVEFVEKTPHKGRDLGYKILVANPKRAASLLPGRSSRGEIWRHPVINTSIVVFIILVTV